jgi:hypothetical protein
MTAFRRPQQPDAAAAQQTSTDERAYLSACADAEPTLRRVLLASDAELADWAPVKAQARRVALQIDQERLDAGSDRQDLARLHALMRQRPDGRDHALAERLVARVLEVRGWIMRRWMGRRPADILRALASGRDAEAMLELAAGGVIRLDDRAARWARSQVAPPPRKSEAQREDDARAMAEAMG